ncbi:hypothetical protein BDV26DRAFT_251150 [Aspergillus bertholletiae]|uniref:Uncharacterized protein n=1 Tax=Aspergillus bertholletiae TaxID=1226010 RepID=A0A5N7BPG9_9EURO|nr:hypothetical protein BDV26DRAFT_251150 [Aspergillus bertholletiae]
MKAYSIMKLSGYATMANDTSNEATLPPKANRLTKRPNPDERSGIERPNKQSKTADKYSNYVTDGEDSGHSSGGDLEYDTCLTPVNGRTRSSTHLLARNKAQASMDRVAQLRSQSSRNPTRSQTSVLDKTVPEPLNQIRQTRGTERIPGSVQSNRSVSTTTAMQRSQTSTLDKTVPGSPSQVRQTRDAERVPGSVQNSHCASTTTTMRSILPKSNSVNPPSKFLQSGQVNAQQESQATETTHEIWSDLVAVIADQRKKYDLAPKFPERQGRELFWWQILDILSESHYYQSAQLLVEKQAQELKELRSEIDAYKKGRESLKAELSKANDNIAKLDQQVKSYQSQNCKDCPRLQGQITTLEEKVKYHVKLHERIRKEFLSGLGEDQPAPPPPPPSSSTSTSAASG